MEINSQEVEKYLLSKNWDFKKVDNNYNILQGCPFCSSKKPNHFYISEEGLWDCKVCGEKGNFYQLKKNLGDISEKINFEPKIKPKFTPPIELKPIIKGPKPSEKIKRSEVEINKEKLFLEAPEILKYLEKERGFTPKAIEHFNLGWDGNNISIPVFEKGKLINIRKRRSPINENKDAPKYTSPKGSILGMFNTDSIKQNNRPVFITEGEMDTIALWSKANGDVQVVSSLIGANGFKKEWSKQYFKGKRRIFICYDSDDAGKNGAEKIAINLGVNRCRIIDLPNGYKDLNDFLKVNSLVDFKKLIPKARKVYSTEQVCIESIAGVLGRVKEQMDSGGDMFSGLETGYPSLDNLLKRMRPGNVVVISGATSLGKTFLAQNIIYNLAKQGVCVMFFSLEMTPEQVAERFIMLDSGINTDKFSGGILELDKTEYSKVDKSIYQLSQYPIYFYNGPSNINKDGLALVSQQAVDLFGCQIIVIDHLHYFSNDSEDTGEVSAIMRETTRIARDNDIPIILISHIRKTFSEDKMPTISDLRNSSLIGQDAEIVIMLHKEHKPGEVLDPNMTKVAVLKNRHGGIGSTFLHFSLDNCRFTEYASNDNENEKVEQAEQKPPTNQKLFGGKDNY